jgi:hypothetical protein
MVLPKPRRLPRLMKHEWGFAVNGMPRVSGTPFFVEPPDSQKLLAFRQVVL